MARPNERQGARLRWVGVAAALIGAALYLLIGIGFLSVGQSNQEATTDLFGFGALMAGVSVIAAVAIWRLRSRAALALVAAFQLIPLLGYVVFAGYREPAFELWGGLIKVSQVVVLVSAGGLALRVNASAAATRRPSPKGQVA